MAHQRRERGEKGQYKQLVCFFLWCRIASSRADPLEYLESEILGKLACVGAPSTFEGTTSQDFGCWAGEEEEEEEDTPDNSKEGSSR